MHVNLPSSVYGIEGPPTVPVTALTERESPSRGIRQCVAHEDGEDKTRHRPAHDRPAAPQASNPPRASMPASSSSPIINRQSVHESPCSDLRPADDSLLLAGCDRRDRRCPRSRSTTRTSRPSSTTTSRTSSTTPRSSSTRRSTTTTRRPSTGATARSIQEHYNGSGLESPSVYVLDTVIDSSLLPAEDEEEVPDYRNSAIVVTYQYFDYSTNVESEMTTSQSLAMHIIS